MQTLRCTIKRAGKNRYADYSSDLDKTIQRQASIEQALRHKNFDEEFKLGAYMPYMDSTGSQVIGVGGAVTLGVATARLCVPPG
ncbi:hypothetical protein O9929_03085 [Vibrio lentus]|nr:hypothetical protein [Vibrio lentus]